MWRSGNPTWSNSLILNVCTLFSNITPEVLRRNPISATCIHICTLGRYAIFLTRGEDRRGNWIEGSKFGLLLTFPLSRSECWYWHIAGPMLVILAFSLASCFPSLVNRVLMSYRNLSLIHWWVNNMPNAHWNEALERTKCLNFCTINSCPYLASLGSRLIQPMLEMSHVCWCCSASSSSINWYYIMSTMFARIYHKNSEGERGDNAHPCWSPASHSQV